MASGWRIVGLAAIIGLLGQGIAELALGPQSSSTGPTGASFHTPVTPGGRLLRAVRGPTATGAGLELLREAAAACQDSSYRGSLVERWRDRDQASATVVEVWHLPGRLTLVQAAGTQPAARGAVTGARAFTGGEPYGILGVSGPLLTLLQANYLIVYAGHGSADRRRALVVEVWRPDGNLAARFWLDATTKLPLRREMFDPAVNMISDDAFTGLELGDPGPAGTYAASVEPWPAQLDPARLMALRAQGWQLPGRLPGNLSLFAVSQTATRLGPVLDLEYSDGLAVVSVFVQRGELGRPMPGWRPVTLHGRTIYSVEPRGQSFAWSAGGFVYIVVADAPLETVSLVVAAMPGAASPGFWQRIARGLHRMASWINPLR